MTSAYFFFIAAWGRLTRRLQVYFCYMKAKVDRCDCTRIRDISLLRVVDKVYSKVLMKRLRESTGRVVCGEGEGCRRGKGAGIKYRQ